LVSLGTAAIGNVGGKEGLKLATYPDIVGVWTGCYGETNGMRFTKASAIPCSLIACGSRDWYAEVSQGSGCDTRKFVPRLTAAKVQGEARAQTVVPELPLECREHMERVVPKLGEMVRWNTAPMRSTPR
jgi:GH24 family phage-related lysozyme (muramidase)